MGVIILCCKTSNPCCIVGVPLCPVGKSERRNKEHFPLSNLRDINWLQLFPAAFVLGNCSRRKHACAHVHVACLSGGVCVGGGVCTSGSTPGNECMEKRHTGEG